MNVLDSISGSLGVRSPEICKSKNVKERTGDKQEPGDWRKGTGEAAGTEVQSEKIIKSEWHCVPRGDSCGGDSYKTNSQMSIS